MPILKLFDLNKNFGGIKAVSNINIDIFDGELLGLIGPNGAGKTTIFNLITGIYSPTLGEINLKNKKGKYIQIHGLKPYQISRMGISRTFQNIRLFSNLSVIDNVKIAMHKDIKYSIFESFLKLPRVNKNEVEIEKKANELLSIVNIVGKNNHLAKNLSYGEQRKLEIARALATNPKIIFMDEPAAGMNPNETEELAKLVREIRDRFKLTIVFIEHDMKFVMNLCERIYVLDFGNIIAEGTPAEIKSNKKVIKAYLGE